MTAYNSLTDAFGVRALPHPDHPKVAKKLWKIPVRVEVYDPRSCATVKKVECWMVAPRAVDAVSSMHHLLCRLPYTTITAWGPKGGVTERLIGYESAVASAMYDGRTDREVIEDTEVALGLEPGVVDWSKTNLVLRGDSDERA